jgi:hypothetical protein
VLRELFDARHGSLLDEGAELGAKVGDKSPDLIRVLIRSRKQRNWKFCLTLYLTFLVTVAAFEYM